MWEFGVCKQGALTDMPVMGMVLRTGMLVVVVVVVAVVVVVVVVVVARLQQSVLGSGDHSRPSLHITLSSSCYYDE